MLSLYTAGPDVFLDQAAALARRKVAICARYGIAGRTPLDTGVDLAAPDAAARIYANNRATMLACDAVIANLTPFRGPSADDGTAFELGFFDALRRPAFAYSNAAAPLAERTHVFLARVPDAVPLAVEAFGLPANLMLPHAVLSRGGLPIFTPQDGTDRAFDSLEVFERLVVAIAERCAPLARLRSLVENRFCDAFAVTDWLHRPLEALTGATPAEAALGNAATAERLASLIA
jgi:nucleoside 2-deoxyribosyltransferase